MNKFEIPAAMIAELDEGDLDQLAADAGATPLDAETASGLADTAPSPNAIFEELPNRPLQQNEVIYQRENISVINRSAPSQYVRLYDNDGRPRIVLRELAAFALSILDGKGNRAFHTKPPVTPKANEYKCRAPGCRKVLASWADRETHEKAYHTAYAAELEARRKRKEELEAKRQQETLNAALTAILKRELGEPLVEPEPEPSDAIRPPTAEMTRSELLGVLMKLFKDRRQELIRMTKEQLLELYAAAYESLTQEQPEEDVTAEEL